MKTYIFVTTVSVQAQNISSATQKLQKVCKNRKDVRFEEMVGKIKEEE